MSDNTLQQITVELGKAISPLSSGLASPENAEHFLSALGFALPPGVHDIGLVGVSVQAVIEKLEIVARSTPAERDDTILMATRISDLGAAVIALIQDLGDLMNTLATLPALTAD